jgi:hypothetical protein
VRTGGYLWHYAAKSAVKVDLADHYVTQNSPAVFYHGGGSFVTAGFDSQNFHYLTIIQF